MILVAEDDPVIMAIVTLYLRRYNYPIVGAVNGQELLDKYIERQSLVNIIITDIMMPKLNGLEAAREIKKINKYVYIIALTALDTDIRITSNAGEYIPWSTCDYYIRKPFNEADFTSAIQSAINHKRASLVIPKITE